MVSSKKKTKPNPAHATSLVCPLCPSYKDHWEKAHFGSVGEHEEAVQQIFCMSSFTWLYLAQRDDLALVEEYYPEKQLLLSPWKRKKIKPV